MSPSIDSDQSPDTDAATQLAQRRLRVRRTALRAVAGLVFIAAIAAIAYYALAGRWYESTDDAYVSGNLVEITPQVAGTVVSFGADDNDLVHLGQTLVKLDPADAAVALAQAEAALAQAVRKVRGLYSAVHTAAANMAVQQAAHEQAVSDYDRRKGLVKSGAIAAEELAHAHDALISSESTLAAARAQLVTARAQVSGTKIETHPDVRAAAAQVRAAWLADQRTTLPAPVSGYVAKRTVQVGQRVQPGTPLMAVVPLGQVWVEANFKETQLHDMRIGQPVKLISDLYGDAVTYHGRIEGLGIGTGSAFSLLPAQNASGNWIKIVQRLPVRIELDPGEFEKHPLRIGLSMTATVNLHDRSGPLLAPKPVPNAVSSTDVFTQQRAEIDALIAKIIHANL